MSYKGSYTTAAIASVGVIGGAYAAYHIYNKLQKPKLPEEWRQVGTLKNLYIYPIKSCGAVVINSVECTLLGLRSGWLRDRVLMIVDSKYNFVTARVYPDLLHVEPTVNNSVLTMKHHEMGTLSVNLAEVTALQSPKTATVWSAPVPVYDCGDEAAEWFSKLLDKPPATMRLVYYASQNCRSSKFHNKLYKFGKNDTGAFTDEVSYHLINEASVDELNTRLTDCVASHKHFRPNFVLDGAQPYDEDNWKFVKIGENIFEVIKPCTRCIMTTIDPETGLRHSRAEPVETLKTYRQIEDPVLRKSEKNSPRLGLQMALRSPPGGRISLNDPIYVA
ncbi:mitochondrial amidoxime-reducing component 1-like [Colias croceus]|uniref:mitochondrial amidoxime-reducing component 1-like n=1 Tax=Colias crocea TaxID=72248 RepID=UPI001E27EC84|nr:mitochondrial amidoxime-reducing component 1-like [Colias croceus]